MFLTASLSLVLKDDLFATRGLPYTLANPHIRLVTTPAATPKDF